jgi:hypothetical protein
MRVPEEPVCIDLFRQNPVFTSLHLKYPVHVVPPQVRYAKNPCSTNMYRKHNVFLVCIGQGPKAYRISNEFWFSLVAVHGGLLQERRLHVHGWDQRHLLLIQGLHAPR